jgi:two-component system phosphate regulon sensor histidine kinase PhoR
VKAYLSLPGERRDFIAAKSDGDAMGNAVKQKIDSILAIAGSSLSSTIYTRTGSYCYLMDVVPENEHNDAIDNSQYKICLCSNSWPLRFDVGFNLLATSRSLDAGSSALLWPSIILILLLIVLFAYAIYVINRQKKLAELKNDFINNLTHEFNTPLFSVGITSNLLLRSEPVQQSEKLRGYVELINIEKNRIQMQVDKILQLTALESGAMIMEKEMVDMHNLINESMASFKFLVTEKGGSLDLEANAVHSMIKGDKLHLRNTLNNLLDNACKYSDHAPVILISTYINDDNLVIKIMDNGIGISESDRNMIFKKFYRVKQGDRHDVKGFGLGLSYVKKVVELHHGSVHVEAGHDKGSVFIIRLPYVTNS